MPDFLVIGYGNTLRRDDGAGIKAAEAVAALNLPDVRVITRQQLVPELAETISRARGVVFVDATADAATEVELRNLGPMDVTQVLAHSTDPRSLLALSKELFGSAPPAWSLAIPARDLDFGDSLSSEAESSITAAIEIIQQISAPSP
jgi:hydrogenase maturation protease